MDIKQILEIPSLSSAKVIAGASGLDRKVSGIMVLEAADIENWGKEGEIILSSYFALKDFDENELRIFFEKLHHIGISAFIIKLDRLLTAIPKPAIDLCNQYAIPLIQLPKSIKYEAVILQIMGPLIDQNVSLLNKHYEVHNQLTRLALKEPSIHTVLNELKKMISCDITFVDNTQDTNISTNFQYEQFELLKSISIPSNQFMNFQYYANTVRYRLIDANHIFKQLSAQIPNLEKNDCHLIIHTKDRRLSNDDLMVVENVVSFLQMKLLQQYAVSQNLFHFNNSLVNDLLNGRMYTPEKITELLHQLHIGTFSRYQVMMIHLSSENANIGSSPDWAVDLFRYMKGYLKQRWFNIAFLEKQDRITFLNNFSKNDKLFTKDLAEDMVQSLRKQHNIPAFHFRIAISTSGDTGDIPKLNQEVLDIQKVLHLFHHPDTIYTYDDLGIYKLFLSANTMDNLEEYIPPAFLAFRTEHPELLDTLFCFLDHNQSFSETAAAMYLHPKTIRYRINQIADKLPFDFSDPEQILEAQVSSRLFRLIN